MSVGMKNTIETPQISYWLGRWEGGWLLLPIFALVGGAYAFGSTPLAEPRALALTLGLLLAGWLPLWRAITRPNWTADLSRWQNWEEEAPLFHWPYLQPETPGAALHQSVSQAWAWWQAEGATALALPLRSAVLATLISLLLSVALGRTALLLTLLLLTWAELAALWHAGQGKVGAHWEALAIAGLPWLLGNAATGGAFSAPVALTALALTALVGWYARPSRLALLGSALLGIILIWQEAPLAAGALLLFSLPGWLLALEQAEVTAHRTAVARWLLLMLALVAGAL